MDKQATLFIEYKSLLFSIAYNMLGSVDTAEDIVQDAFLKWMDADEAAVKHPKAYLVRIVTNSCINYLHSARVQREAYMGIWLPEPLHYNSIDTGAERIEMYHALSLGLLVLMEKLNPRERAIFLLREIFAYDYTELADIFDKSPDNCRQILKRAKEHLGKDARRFQVDMKVHEMILVSGVSMMAILHSVVGAMLWFRIKMVLVLLVILNGAIIGRRQFGQLNKLILAGAGTMATGQALLRVRKNINVFHLTQLILLLTIFFLSAFKFN